MDYNILRVLPRLRTCETEEINTWYGDFDNIIKMAKITDTETIYRLAYSVAEGEARKRLQESHRTLGFFPTLVQIKKYLIETKEPTEIDIYDKLKNISIKEDEELEDYNKTYLELYQKVNDNLKPGIKVSDYLKSIRTRMEACRAVLYDECDSIEDAIKTTNKIQKIREFELGLQRMGGDEYEKTNPIPIFKRITTGRSYSRNFYNNNSGKVTYPNQLQITNVPVLSNHKLICYRCKEEGHKVFQCPYSDEQLIDILSKRVHNNHHTTLRNETQQKN